MINSPLTLHFLNSIEPATQNLICTIEDIATINFMSTIHKQLKAIKTPPHILNLIKNSFIFIFKSHIREVRIRP